MTKATPSSTIPPMTTKVAATFTSYPASVRPLLLELRQLIFDTAAETEGVGSLTEALRWGQPSYLTEETKSGSTVRIAPHQPHVESNCGMYFICNTSLVDDFRDLFGDGLRYEKNRALLFSVGDSIPTNEVRQCVAMALTYHRR